MSWSSRLVNQSKKIRAVQHRRKRHWSQLVAMPDSSSSSGSEGSRISLWVNKRADWKPDVSPSCGPFPHKWIVTVSSSHPHVDFLTNWLAASTKFLVCDEVLVVTTLNDVVVSLIADVSVVQQLGRLFALRDNNSLLVDFNGQVPRERTVHLHDHTLVGDWGSAEHASKTS